MSHDVNVCRQETGMQCTTNVHTVSAYDHRIKYGHTLSIQDSPLIGPQADIARASKSMRLRGFALMRVHHLSGTPAAWGTFMPARGFA